MLKAPVYNQKGEKIGEHEMSAQVFGLQANPSLIHQVLVAQLANVRNAIAHTKMRGEVSGGGKKPWKQKGTGRARHGSTRSPIWRGGGVTFGPRSNRNYEKKVNKKAKKKAVLMCVSDKVSNNKLMLLDNLELSDNKTKTLIRVIKTLPVSGKKILIGLPAVNRNLMGGAKNLKQIYATDAGSLNVKDLLKYEYLLTTVDGLKKIEKTYK